MTDDSLTLFTAEARAASGGLTPEEQAFVLALLADPEMSVGNAAKACGLDPSIGHRWLRKVGVRAYLAAQLVDRRQRHADIRDGVVQALWALATYDIKDAIEEGEPYEAQTEPASLEDAIAVMAGGRLKPPHKLPDTLRAAVTRVKWGKHGWEYQFTDRSTILLALLRHFGELDKGKVGQQSTPAHGGPGSGAIDAEGESTDADAAGVQFVVYANENDPPTLGHKKEPVP